MKIRISVEQHNIDVFLKKIMDKYHFHEADKEELMKVYEEMQIGMGPYAAYRINHRVTGIKMIDDNQCAIVAMTLGIGVDRLSDRYIRAERLNEAYMLDCIANELLLYMYGEFNEAYARFHRRYVQRYVFIGNEISVSAMPQILDEIKGRRGIPSWALSEETTGKSADKTDSATGERLAESNEITANEYGVLTPSKSVVFYAILSENPKQLCEGICMGCNNAECENRINDGVQENSQNIVNKSDEESTRPEETRKNLNYGFQRIFGG